MFKVFKKEIEVAGKKISLETGKIARQADGAIIAKCGETVVMATVVGAKKVNPDVDYFPLSVNYQEKYYAAGKIPYIPIWISSQKAWSQNKISKPIFNGAGIISLSDLELINE